MAEGALLAERQVVVTAMAGLSSLSGIEEWLSNKIVVERRSYECVSRELQQLYPNLRGLSSRTVRRFCNGRGIRATSQLTDSQLDRVVASYSYLVSHLSTELPASGSANCNVVPNNCA